MKRTALDIAADLERGSSKIPSPAGDVPAWMTEAAAELRRQHALILEMREALAEILNEAEYMRGLLVSHGGPTSYAQLESFGFARTVIDKASNG